jgi:hypothetical protein
MDLVPFIYIPRWKLPETPRSRFPVVPLSGGMRLTSTCRSPLLKSFSIAVPASPKAHRNWPALLEPAAYVFDGRVRWDHIGNNHPSVGIPRHQRNRPADLWRHRSRRSLIVLGVAGFFAAWVCKIGRGVSETPLRSSPTAAKSQSASVRIDARPRTTPQARALLVRRLKLRAGRASRDR